MCGAISGSIMAIGIVFGRDCADDVLDYAYSRVQELQRIFIQRYGSLNCFELTGYDLGTPEGRQQFRSSGTRDKCREYTGGAIRIAAELIGTDETI